MHPKMKEMPLGIARMFPDPPVQSQPSAAALIRYLWAWSGHFLPAVSDADFKSSAITRPNLADENTPCGHVH